MPGRSGAPFATIQHGIDTVASGGTVTVAAGTYDESLTIDKPVTLDGAQSGVDARGRSGPESVITGSGGVVYTAGATTGTIDGFTLQGYTGSTSEIMASDVGSGWDFSNDVIDVSYGGIYLNSDGVADPATTTDLPRQLRAVRSRRRPTPATTAVRSTCGPRRATPPTT